MFLTFFEILIFETPCFLKICQSFDGSAVSISKFIHSEKATKFCEISTVDVTITINLYAGHFAKVCHLLRIHEL